IVNAVASGRMISGFLRRSDIRITKPRAQPIRAAILDNFAFTPELVYWSRISRRRCYWSRCSFCVQNQKYDDPRAPAKSEIFESLERVGALVHGGCRNIIFSDEAVSPASLRPLSDGILERGISFKWACRCKLETSFTSELMELAASAGCYEI